MEAFVKMKLKALLGYSVVSVTKMYLVLFIVALKVSQGDIFDRRRWENKDPWGRYSYGLMFSVCVFRYQKPVS